MKTLFIKPTPEWDPQLSRCKNATRNTQPRITEEPNIDEVFKQELYNPRVRDHEFKGSLNEELYEDLATQLHEMTKQCAFWEQDATKWWRRAVALKRENEQLKTKGFWGHFWDFILRTK